jgi:exodeoxyribonuclease VII large subunit
VIDSDDRIVWSVSDFVAVFNQTLEFAYPSVSIVGEISNFRISKNKWVYFDLKDEFSSVKFFGTVYSLPGPLEDGITVQVAGSPRLHNLYGFSVNYYSIQPVGEGSIKKAQDLLKQKLEKEGLFDDSRKRYLPYPPTRVGLVASSESAAYHDFIKIINQRWAGLNIDLFDVQVQGESAAEQIIEAIENLNYQGEAEIIVITRGGGSSDDLAVFSNERVVRAVANSRIPTIVAIGHEIDISLSELAADKRASTPSNAAELIVPDKLNEKVLINSRIEEARNILIKLVINERGEILSCIDKIGDRLNHIVNDSKQKMHHDVRIIEALNPNNLLAKGYTILRKDGKVVKSINVVSVGDEIKATLLDGELDLVLSSKGDNNE